MKSTWTTLQRRIGGEMGVAAQRRRRIALVIVVFLVLVLTLIDPTGRPQAVSSGQVGIAFFAALLTGGAIIFGLSFSSATLWPSLREINEYVGVSDWVTVASLGTLALAVGVLVNLDSMVSFGSTVVIFGDLMGLVSFLRILSLASPDRRKVVLAQRLGEEFTLAATHSERPTLVEHGSRGVLHRFITEFESSLTRSDSTTLRELVGEVEQATSSLRSRDRGLHAGGSPLHLPTELAFDLLHRLAQRALNGGLDPRGAVDLQTQIADGLIGSAVNISKGANDSQAAAILGRLSLHLAWTASTAWTMAARNSLESTTARSLIVSSGDLRGRILRSVDPDPSGLFSLDEQLVRPISTPLGCLTWLRCFVEFHGAPMTVAYYPTFQLLSGERYKYNIWDGAPILAQLRFHLYSSPSNTDEAVATRTAFGSASDFDRTFLALSVGLIATLRDARLRSPTTLGLPDLSDEPRRLAYELWSFATHRYFDTAIEGLETLARYSSQRLPNDLWCQSGVSLSQIAAPGPPIIDPISRMSALGLAIALRLAPLDPFDSPTELHGFLSRLDPSYLNTIRLLTDRILPNATAKAPVDAIIEQLCILHEMPSSGTFTL
ncbi:MAG: hypothetical protein HKL82_06880 [Acidimicrobiaceae bacterium]|nr:hypothetical protein [Acidimicrobiaceae bacterium]